MQAKPALQRTLELASHLSLRSLYRLGDLLAFFVRHTSNQVSRQARANIELCFADLDKNFRRQLYRDSLRHTCYSMTELAAVWCWPVEKLLARVSTTDICPDFERSGQSRIVLAPHLGSWETLVIWLGHYHDAITLYKHQKNHAVDRFIREARMRGGGNLVSTKKGGLRQLLIGLKAGNSLLILPDQKPGNQKARVESSFFGISAPTMTLVNNLCSKIDCEVYLASICRSEPPGEFSLRIERLEHARLAADESDSAQYMNDQIETLARRQLAQYQWGYRRFQAKAYAALRKDRR